MQDAREREGVRQAAKPVSGLKGALAFASQLVVALGIPPEHSQM